MPSDDEDEGCGSTPSNHTGGRGSNRKGRQKRGVLPKQATSIMRAWLFQHLVVSKIEKNNIYLFLVYLLQVINNK